MNLITSLLFCALAFSHDFSREVKLRESVQSWLLHVAQPKIQTQINAQSIGNIGFYLKEKKNVLPPELGGTKPGTNIYIEIDVRFQAWVNDRFPGNHIRRVDCGFFHKLLAKTNERGNAQFVIAHQTFRAPITCKDSY